MAIVKTKGARIAGVCTCVPTRRFDNLADTREFSEDEVRKVTGMAGVSARRVAGDAVCSSDLCSAAAARLMERLSWEAGSIDALIFITQTPDYLLPSTSTVVHKTLGLGDHCAAFDVGLGCSGYPYGLWLAAMMLQTGGVRRALVLHGETPTRVADPADRSVALLFGDAGSATALEADPEGGEWWFGLHSDGQAYDSMIVPAGGFRQRFTPDSGQYCVHMNGALIFNFTLKRVPAVIDETLAAAGRSQASVDYFLLHQSNQFIMKHLATRQGLPPEKVPIILKEFGNTGGASIPLAMTVGELKRPEDRPLELLLVGYGVGLSWASALLQLPPTSVLEAIELENS